MLAAPEVAFRSCADCQEHVYDEQTGKRAEHGGKPIKRPRGTLPPCGYGADKCAKGSPTAGRELTPQNWAAWWHYQECRATGHFPDDEIVRRNAGLILQAVEQHERGERRMMQQSLLAVLGIKRAL